MICCGRKSVEVDENNPTTDSDDESDAEPSETTTGEIESVTLPPPPQSAASVGPLSAVPIPSAAIGKGLNLPSSSNDNGESSLMRISPDKVLSLKRPQSILIMNEAANNESPQAAMTSASLNDHPIYQEPGSDAGMLTSLSSSSSSSIRVSFQVQEEEEEDAVNLHSSSSSRFSRTRYQSPRSPPLSPSLLINAASLDHSHHHRRRRSSDARLRELTHRQRLCLSLGELVLEIA